MMKQNMRRCLQTVSDLTKKKFGFFFSQHVQCQIVYEMHKTRHQPEVLKKNSAIQSDFRNPFFTASCFYLLLPNVTGSYGTLDL